MTFDKTPTPTEPEFQDHPSKLQVDWAREARNSDEAAWERLCDAQAIRRGETPSAG